MKSSTYKLIKLDQRHNGHKQFKYAVMPNSFTIYNNWRIWTWETYGPSCELVYVSPTAEPIWAWHSSTDGRMRLYFKSDEELALFQLRWT